MWLKLYIVIFVCSCIVGSWSCTWFVIVVFLLISVRLSLNYQRADHLKMVELWELLDRSSTTVHEYKSINKIFCNNYDFNHCTYSLKLWNVFRMRCTHTQIVIRPKNISHKYRCGWNRVARMREVKGTCNCMELQGNVFHANIVGSYYGKLLWEVKPGSFLTVIIKWEHLKCRCRLPALILRDDAFLFF